MGKHFVLIHGAWHGGWCWDGVIEALESAGHTGEAPTLPGHNPGDDWSSVTLDSYVGKIVEVLQGQAVPVVLVGHSSAGVLLQVAAPKAPGKIERLVFHNAFVLADGKAHIDVIPADVAEAMSAAAQASPDNSVPVNEECVRGVLMAGEAAELQDALIERLVPQPFALFTTKVATGRFEALAVPRTVLLSKDDASLPTGAYLDMARNLGRFDLIEITGGHEALVTHPQAVAEGLIEAVA